MSTVLGGAGDISAMSNANVSTEDAHMERVKMALKASSGDAVKDKQDSKSSAVNITQMSSGHPGSVNEE